MAKNERKIKEPKKPQCRDFEMDLTDYVTGDMTFLTKEKIENLIGHLQECAKCLNELWTWKATVATMRGAAQAGKPEYKKKVIELAERIKERALKCEPMSHLNDERIKDRIGQAAGLVWRFLAPRCWVTFNDIARGTNLKPRTLAKAIGWLSRENKVMLNEDEQHLYICLRPDQKEIYFAQPEKFRVDDRPGYQPSIT